MNTLGADNNFYQMTRKTFAEIQQHNLSKAEWELFLYFSTLDPFGDRYHDYEPAAIMLELGISKATFYRALAKLQDLKLIDSRFTKGQVRNLKGRKAKENQSHAQDKSLTHETLVSPMRLESQPRENERPEPIQSKDSSLFQTPSDSSDFKEKEREERTCFENGAITSEYDTFLRRLIQDFKTPVVAVELWIEKNAHRKSFQKQFLKSRTTFQRTDIPPLSKEEKIDPFLSALGRNRAKWQNYPNRRHEVEVWAKQHPNVVITDDGPVERQDKSTTPLQAGGVSSAAKCDENHPLL